MSTFAEQELLCCVNIIICIKTGRVFPSARNVVVSLCISP